MSAKSLKRLLLVDDDVLVAALLTAEFSQRSITVHSVTDAKQALCELEHFRFDGILLDINLDGVDGRDFIADLTKRAPLAELLMLTACDTPEIAADSIVRGASGYIRKTSDSKHIVDKILSYWPKETSGKISVAESVDQAGQFDIVGSSSPIVKLRESIRILASVDSTVLIQGESGTGKELVARGLHNASARLDQRFDAINCSAIPESLLETELFGYKKGAFTDARTDRKGLFEICATGTLFLDEIAEMPVKLQAKLLRVLQERVVVPVGGTTAVPIKTRIIAASNRDLRDCVKQGTFREDLYFRLSVLHVYTPPLRERLQDIGELSAFFVAMYNLRHGKNVAPPSRRLIAQLQSYGWPGNVRELQNAIERGVVLSQDEVLSAESIFTGLSFEHLPLAGVETATDERLRQMFEQPLTEAKASFEKAYLESRLTDAAGNISEVARQTGRYRADIYRLIHKYGINTDKAGAH